MAKLIYYYGTMASSKTANALITRFQHIQVYEEVWLIKPEIDTRDDIFKDGKRKAVIKSRIGIEAEAEILRAHESFKDFYNRMLAGDHETPHIIIVDEAQFLSEEQVEELKEFATYMSTPVYCYGLRTDFTSHLFPGSKRLFELADEIIEIPSVCECGEPAIINGKFYKGRLVTSGDQIDIGGDEKYRPLCYNHWRYYMLKAGGKIDEEDDE